MITLDESIKRDQPQAKNVRHYQQMVEFFSGAEDKEALNDRAMLFILDMTYDRADLALAIHTVEIARGWHY